MADKSGSDAAFFSKSLFLMMVAIFGGIALLFGGGMFIASRVIHAMGLRATSDKTTVRTPIADFRIQKRDEVGPGLPVYPRASLVVPGQDAALAVSGDDQPQIVYATYHTNDSREFVLDWYAGHLSPDFVRHNAGVEPLPETLREARIPGNDIAFLGERGNQIRIVALTEDSTGTKITLERTSKRESKPGEASPPPKAPAQPQATVQPEAPR
jgi:hypothetical protein